MWNTSRNKYRRKAFPQSILSSPDLVWIKRNTYAKCKGNKQNICWKYTLKKDRGELVKNTDVEAGMWGKTAPKKLLLLWLWMMISSKWGQQRSQSGIPKICGKVCAVTEICQCREKIFRKFGNSYWNRAANEIFLSLEEVAPLKLNYFLKCMCGPWTKNCAKQLEYTALGLKTLRWVW